VSGGDRGGGVEQVGGVEIGFIAEARKHRKREVAAELAQIKNQEAACKAATGWLA
jgi:hypothetical protein